jgi:hypothetical protein
MDWTQEEKSMRNSTAESFARLSIGLWTVSLIEYLSSGMDLPTYILLSLGILFVLISGFLFIPWNLKQKSVVNYLSTSGTMRIVKPLLWLLVIAPFGVNLVKTKIPWLIITGLIAVILAFVIFYVSIWKSGKPKN